MLQTLTSSTRPPVVPPVSCKHRIGNFGHIIKVSLLVVHLPCLPWRQVTQKLTVTVNYLNQITAKVWNLGRYVGKNYAGQLSAYVLDPPCSCPCSGKCSSGDTDSSVLACYFCTCANNACKLHTSNPHAHAVVWDYVYHLSRQERA